MRRLNFSLLLLSILILALTSCSVIESRISHALRGDINSVAHTEKSIKENPKEIIINWKNGNISFVKTNDKEIIVTEENFDKEVLLSKQPVLVDFWATWCGPCKMLAPIIAEIAEEKKGSVKVCKVNVDDARQLAIDYGVSSIPTVMVFRNGEIKATSVGYRPKEELEALLQ